MKDSIKITPAKEVKLCEYPPGQGGWRITGFMLPFALKSPEEGRVWMP